MGLPSSGQISMNDIRAELGVPTQSPFSLDTARAGGYVAINQFSPSKPPSSGQVSLSSWYSYCQNCGYNSGTFYYSSVNAATACAGTPNQTLYWSGTLTTGTILYTDSTGNTEAAQGYWSNGTNAYYQSCPDGCYPGIISITACATVNSATVFMNSFVDYPYGYADAATACSLGGYTGYSTTVYYTGTLGNGTLLYFDNSLTNAFDADGSYGYYWISGYSFTYSGAVGSYTACAIPTLFYIENSSLDIVITDVKVNGVSLTGVTGTGFPLYSGDTVNGYSNQIGTQDVDIYYSLSTPGQHIEGYDSDLNFYCNATVGTGGGKVTQFGGAYVGAGTFQIYALDGTC